MTPSASRTEAPTIRIGTSALPSGGSDEEVLRQFREFREAAVRLAERVRDLSLVDPDPVAAARADLHLVRSIFGKWSSDVLIALHALPSAGFEELRRNLSGISPRVLSLKLKELEQNGMVHREILDSRPPRVRYSLTDRGWTVAWLSQPVLLYLRFTDPTRPSAASATVEQALGTERRGAPSRRSGDPGGAMAAFSRETRAGSRSGRGPIGRSTMETVAL